MRVKRPLIHACFFSRVAGLAIRNRGRSSHPQGAQTRVGDSGTWSACLLACLFSEVFQTNPAALRRRMTWLENTAGKHWWGEGRLDYLALTATRSWICVRKWMEGKNELTKGNTYSNWLRNRKWIDGNTLTLNKGLFCYLYSLSALFLINIGCQLAPMLLCFRGMVQPDSTQLNTLFWYQVLFSTLFSTADNPPPPQHPHPHPYSQGVKYICLVMSHSISSRLTPWFHRAPLCNASCPTFMSVLCSVLHTLSSTIWLAQIVFIA